MRIHEFSLNDFKMGDNSQGGICGKFVTYPTQNLISISNPHVVFIMYILLKKKYIDKKLMDVLKYRLENLNILDERR
jgi:hypothetical protein